MTEHPEPDDAELRRRWERKAAPQVEVAPDEVITGVVRDEVSRAVDAWLRDSVAEQRGDDVDPSLINLLACRGAAGVYACISHKPVGRAQGVGEVEGGTWVRDV